MSCSGNSLLMSCFLNSAQRKCIGLVRPHQSRDVSHFRRSIPFFAHEDPMRESHTKSMAMTFPSCYHGRMDVTLAVLADYANITREGKLNVMGLFTSMNTASFPYVHPQMQLVLELEAGAAEWDKRMEIEIKLLDEDAKQVFAVQGALQVPRGDGGRRVRMGTVLTINNIRFEKPGDYLFAVLVGGDTKKEIPLQVNLAPTPPKPQLPSA